MFFSEMVENMELHLSVNDTRQSLVEEKLMAETSFMTVAQKYHLIWLSLLSEKGTISELENIKSIQTNIHHAPIMGQVTSSKEYLQYLYDSISYHTFEFKTILNKLGSETGLQIIIAPLKGKKRVWEKALFDYNKDQSKVVDIGRGSAIAKDLKSIIIATRWMLQHCKVVRMKNRFSDGRKQIMARGGYRDILINIDLNGFIFEIQIHLQVLYNLKEESHLILDVARAAIEPTIYKLKLLDQLEEHDKLIQRLQDCEVENTNLKILLSQQQNTTTVNYKRKLFLLTNKLFQVLNEYDNKSRYGLRLFFY